MGNKGGKAKAGEPDVDAREISDGEWNMWKPVKIEGHDIEAKEMTPEHKIVIRKQTPVPYPMMKERVGLLQNMEPHRGLAKVVGILKGTEHVYVVTEYVEGTSLETLIKTKAPITWGEAIRYASEICELGAHFHKDGAFHRNVKTSNIIVLPKPEEGTTLKLTDFNAARGPAEDKAQAGMTKAGKDKPEYIAPEQFKPKAGYGPPVDVYAFGIVLWSILTGSLTAYPGLTSVKIIQSVIKGGRPVIPDYVPDSLKKLLGRIWEENPEKRITFPEANAILLGPVRGELVGKLDEAIPRI